MSTIQLENIKHPDASGNALELASDGTLAVSGNVTGNINISGNVGVGVTTATQKLHVQSAGTNYIMTRDSTPGGIAGIIMQNGSDTRGIRINNATTEIYDHSAGVARVLVNSGGVVTTPYQPSFEVSQPATWVGTGAASTYAITTWNRTHHNVGSHFDTTNGRFTAPVNGVYAFHGIMMGMSGSSPHLAFGINGSLNGGGKSYINNQMWVHPVNSENLIQIYHVVYLDAGDYIRLYTYSYNSVSNGDRCYFGGHLVG